MVSLWSWERARGWLLIFLPFSQMCGTQRSVKRKEWWCYCKGGEVVLWASWKVERGGKGRRLDYHVETSSPRCNPINMCFRKWGQELQMVGGGDCLRGGAHDAWWLEVSGKAKKRGTQTYCWSWKIGIEKGGDVMHPQTPWKIQMRIRKWKQQKKKELRYIP